MDLLGQVDDHMLKDIGVSRSAVIGCVSGMRSALTMLRSGGMIAAPRRRIELGRQFSQTLPPSFGAMLVQRIAIKANAPPSKPSMPPHIMRRSATINTSPESYSAQQARTDCCLGDRPYQVTNGLGLAVPSGRCFGNFCEHLADAGLQ